MAYSTIEFKNTKLPYLGQDGVRMNLANEPALNYRGQASGNHGWFWVTVPDEDTAHWLMDQGVNVKDYTRIDRDSGEPVTSYRVKVQVNLQALFNGPIIHWYPDDMREIVITAQTAQEDNFSRAKALTEIANNGGIESVSCVCSLYENKNNPGKKTLYLSFMAVTQRMVIADPYARDRAEANKEVDMPF